MHQNTSKCVKMPQNTSKRIQMCPNSSKLKLGQVRVGQDESRRVMASQGSQGKSGRVRVSQDKSERVRTSQDESGQVRARQDELWWVRTNQDESGQKYFIQSPIPLPATIFQRPLDNFVLKLIMDYDFVYDVNDLWRIQYYVIIEQKVRCLVQIF